MSKITNVHSVQTGTKVDQYLVFIKITVNNKTKVIRFKKVLVYFLEWKIKSHSNSVDNIALVISEDY